MPTATQPTQDRIAILFDFDMTLAPGTLDAVVTRCGQDPEAWRAERVDPRRRGGFEQILAETLALVELSQSGGPPVTRALMQEVGRGHDLFEGVPAMFAELRRIARAAVPGISVEFHVVSCGLYDVMAATRIADELDSLWGTKLHFDDRTGEVVFPKLILTRPEKVRYVLALCKGLDPCGANAPAHVFRKVASADWHVPLDQVVYVGDGLSDMPVFDLLADHGGLAIGVYQGDAPAEWEGLKAMDPDRRVQNLAPADYREESELMRSLALAVDSIARKVALCRLGRGE